MIERLNLQISGIACARFPEDEVQARHADEIDEDGDAGDDEDGNEDDNQSHDGDKNEDVAGFKMMMRMWMHTIMMANMRMKLNMKMKNKVTTWPLNKPITPT